MSEYIINELGASAIKRVVELEAKNAELEKKLEISMEALEFYGNIESWRNHTYPKGFKFSQLDSEDGSDFSQFQKNTILIAGNRARKALAAIKDA